MKTIMESPIGKIGIEEKNGAISDIWFAPDIFPKEQTPLLKEAERQLSAYFDRKLTEFDLPLAPQGTVFQKQVWDALCKIPYGQTASYGDIARMIGNPKACRAVGGANNKNPIAIVIPCHRIIGMNGRLVGYGGGLDIKQFLLALER